MNPISDASSVLHIGVSYSHGRVHVLLRKPDPVFLPFECGFLQSGSGLRLR
jgi:hypothetical protein